MKIIPVMLLCIFALSAISVLAQDNQANTNMQILLDKVKADKKLVVAANMDLTEAEGKVGAQGRSCDPMRRFWI